MSVITKSTGAEAVARQAKGARVARLAMLAALSLGVGTLAGGAGLRDVEVAVDTQAAKPGQRLVSPSPSPDGKFIGYEGIKGNSRFLYLRRTADGATRQLVVKKSLFSAGSSFESELDWCRSAGCGGAFVFVSGQDNNLDLFLANAADEESLPQRLTQHGRADYQARWSPTALYLVFLSTRDRETGADLYLLTLAPAASDGGLPQPKGLYRLTRFDGGVLYPDWAPDGSALVFSGLRTAAAGGSDSYDVWTLDKAAIDEAVASEPAAGAEQATDLSGVLTAVALTREGATDEIAPSVAPSLTAIAYYASDADSRGLANARDEKPQMVRVLRLAPAASGGLSPRGEPVAVLARAAGPNEDHGLRGPVWLPGGRYLAAVRDDPEAFNPIVVIDAESGKQAAEFGETKMNCDLVSVPASDGSSGHQIFFSAHQQQSTAIFSGTIQF